MADEDRSSRHGPRFADSEEDLPTQEVTTGGSLVYEYDEPILFGPAERDPVLATEVERHVSKHLGPVEEVFHEPFSEVVEVEVLRVDPTDEHPFHILITCGMAQLPMAVPEGFDDWRYSELMLCLPIDWSFDDADLEGDAGWPVRLLQELARFPHQFGTWLGLDHTVPHSDPPEPYAPSTRLCGCIVEMPAHLPEAFHRLRLTDGRHLHFLHVTPLFADEMDYKLTLGAEALLERFDELAVSMVIDPHRPCVVHPQLPGSVGEARSDQRGTPWWRQFN